MISGIISLDDYLAAQRLHQRRPLRRALTLAAMLLLVGVPLFVFGTRDSVSAIGGVLIGIGGGGMIGLALLYGWKVPRKLRRLHAQQAALRHAVTYAWDETGLEIAWSGGQARRPWSDFIRYRESPQVLLLYHNDMLFDVVPTAWFADAAQREAFRRLAARVGTDAVRAG